MNKENMSVEEAARNFLENHANRVSGEDGPYARYETNRIQLNWLVEAFQQQRQAAVEEYKASLWKPIEEAKKDGNPYWLWVPSWRFNGEGYWSRDKNRWQSAYDDEEIGQPTHYQPLPTPPESIINKAKETD